MTFIEAQRDLLVFVSLFAFVVCALESLVLNREEPGRRWSAYFGFLVFQSLTSAWLMVSSVVPGSPLAPLIGPLLQSVAFGSLLSFSAPLRAPSRARLRVFIAWAIVLVGADVFGAFLGYRALSVLVGLLFALPGSLFAWSFFRSDPSIPTEGRPWLVAHAWTLVALAVLALARSLLSAALPRLPLDSFTVLAPLVAMVMALTLSIHGWRSFVRANRGYGRSLTRFAIYASYLALPLVLFLGGLLTDALGRRAFQELRTSYSKDAEDITAKISAQTGEIDRDVAIIGASPRPSAFVMHPDEKARRETVDLLDRIADQVRANCFIFDKEGRPLAASRNASDSYLAISRSNAPAIVDALGGGYGRYFMVNAHTHAREFYSSAPISDPVAGTVGVAVIEQNIESIFPEIDPGSVAFLVDENGVILFSNAQSLDYRALWPVPPADQDAARADGRYGYVSLVPVLGSKPADGRLITWDDAPRVASRSFLYIPGWSIVLLSPVEEILFYRLAGLLATLIITLVIVAFSTASQMSLIDEGRLERSEGLFRALVEGSPNWVSMLDPTGAFLYVNRAGRMALGIEESAPPASIGRVLGPANVALLTGRIEMALHGTIVSSEEVLPSSTGDVKVWRITLLPLAGTSESRNVFLIASDITDMRRAEARLVRAERLAAVGTLAAGVAHQFNNINAVALGYVQVLEADIALSRRARDYVHSIREALERSVQITTRLLPLSASATEMKTLQLGDAVRAALPSLQPDFEKEGATLELSLEETASVLMNPEQLDFVVVTLLVNACHAVMGQPVRSITVSTGVDDGEAFLRVQDSGIGIATEKLSSIFTPFFTEKGEHAASQSPMARVQGIGLSLSVVNSIVAAREGRIEVESAPGEGATFTVWMPSG